MTRVLAACLRARLAPAAAQPVVHTLAALVAARASPAEEATCKVEADADDAVDEDDEAAAVRDAAAATAPNAAAAADTAAARRRQRHQGAAEERTRPAAAAWTDTGGGEATSQTERGSDEAVLRACTRAQT